MYTLSLRHFARTRRALAFLAGAALCATALASHAESPPQQAVHYTAADLASERGVAALYADLKAAAREVCSQHKRMDPASVRKYQRCYTNALSNAVNDVNAQALTALHTRPSQKSASVRRDRVGSESDS